jgi:hypothetical protein
VRAPSTRTSDRMAVLTPAHLLGHALNDGGPSALAAYSSQNPSHNSAQNARICSRSLRARNPLLPARRGAGKVTWPHTPSGGLTWSTSKGPRDLRA